MNMLFTRKKLQNYYSYAQAIVLSFFSPKIYVDAGKRWRGIGAFYLLLLAFILSIPLAFQFIQETRHYFAEWIEPSVKAMPTLLIHEGKMVMEGENGKELNEKQAVWIWPTKPLKKSIDQNPAMVINLPRTMASFDAIFIPILITEDFIRIQTSSPFDKKVVTDFIQISKDKDQELGSKELGEITQQVKKNLMTTAYSYLSMFMWIVIFSLFLCASIVTPMLSYAMLRLRLSWLKSARILAIAITPSIIISEVLYFTHQLTEYRAFFLIGLALLYYLFGVRAYYIDKEPELTCVT